jgi:hypothetical protein
MNSVHKRMHASQCEEFRLLFECFREHPESFWESNKKPSYKWDQETFIRALDDYDLTPQSDPNTSSMLHRLLKAQALQMLAMANPQLYDPIAVNQNSIRSIGYSNPEQFMAPPSALGKPTPEMQIEQAKSAADTMKANAAMMVAQGKVKLDTAKAAKEGMGDGGEQGPNSVDMLKAKAMMMDARTKAKLAKIKHGDVLLQDANDQEDRQAKMKLETMALAKEVLIHKSDQAADMQKHRVEVQSQANQHQAGLAVDMARHRDTMAQGEAKLGADVHKHETGLEAQMEQHKADSKIAEKGLKAKAAKPRGDIKS